MNALHLWKPNSFEAVLINDYTDWTILITIIAFHHDCPLVLGQALIILDVTLPKHVEQKKTEGNNIFKYLL